MQQRQLNLPTVLLVEDNVDDYNAAVRSFKAAHFDHPIQWCKSGEEALGYLVYVEKYVDE